MKPLSARRARFVEEYLIDLNPRAACVRAGYKAEGWNYGGYALLKKPEIAAAIRTAMDERSARLRLDADRVVRELMAIAFSDVRRVVHWRAMAPAEGADPEQEETRYDLQVVESGDIDEASAMAIATVRKSGRGGLYLRMHDKLPALALLGRHLGMFTPQLEVKVEPFWPSEKVERDYKARMAALTPERAAALREAMHAALGKPFGPLPKD